MSPEEKRALIAEFAKEIMGSFEAAEEIQFPQPPAQSVMESRLQIAKIITSRPEHFKVCEGCDSIVKESAPVCPSCLAYRFEDDPEKVIAQAIQLASQEPKETFI